RLDPEVINILRLSAYQLLHLTRVPAAAVVDDAVDLTRRAKKKSASGFVNAILRSLSRQRHALPLPARPADPANRDAALDYLSTRLSHPRWLAARWYDRLGFARAEQWMQFNNQPARLTLRANRLKISPDALAARLDRDDVVVEPGRWAAAAVHQRDVRLRAGGRTLLGPRHAAARSGHPVAAGGIRPARPVRGSGRDASPRRRVRKCRRTAHLRHLLERAGGERRRRGCLPGDHPGVHRGGRAIHRRCPRGRRRRTRAAEDLARRTRARMLFRRGLPPWYDLITAWPFAAASTEPARP